MAYGKKGSRGYPSPSATPIVTYTITVAHEPHAECDSCAMPRAVLIEQEDDAWVCEICLGDNSYQDFWRTAMVNGVYSWGDGF